MVSLGKKVCIFTLQIYAKLYGYMLMCLILLCWLHKKQFVSFRLNMYLL